MPKHHWYTKCSNCKKLVQKPGKTNKTGQRFCDYKCMAEFRRKKCFSSSLEHFQHIPEELLMPEKKYEETKRNTTIATTLPAA